MRNIFLIILSLILFSSNSYSDENVATPCKPLKGILMENIDETDVGEIIEYCYPDHENDLKVYIEDHEYNDVDVIPYDPEFSPSRIFLVISDNDNMRGNEDYIDYLKRKLNLSKSVLINFPEHRLADDANYYYCKYLSQIDSFQSDGKTDFEESRICYQDYLTKHKNGKYKDTVQWEIAKIENYIYEIEGFAEIALEGAYGFEEFLKNNQGNKHTEEIKEKIARLYRIAFECIKYDGNDSMKYSDDDATRIYKLAYDIYMELSKSDDPQVKEEAIVSMYNMNNNRSTYNIQNRNNDW